jgi:hypothetical protein
MTETNLTMLISELSEEDRKAAEQSVEQCSRMLQMMVRQCDLYLRDYAAGKQNVAKLYGVLVQTQMAIKDASTDLIQRHSPKDIARVLIQ